ncbi:hypothetical protein FB451DRAFT_1192339 [Mycena latifolia]|nr:hypothetical protein FB451DRAFT_1192339 [Mycena latifolia]
MFSGKVARALANHHHYLAQNTRKKSKHPLDDSTLSPTSILGLPPLDIKIQEMYNVPLPESHPLFREALTKPGALDESDLHRWKAEPPFVEDEDMTDPYSDRYHRFTQNLASVLHGVRLREQRERDVLRRAEFTNNGTAAGMAALCEEVVYLLSSWERVKVLDIYDQYHHSREYVMHQHYLQWQARTVYHLYHLKFLN